MSRRRGGSELVRSCRRFPPRQHKQEPASTGTSASSPHACTRRRLPEAATHLHANGGAHPRLARWLDVVSNKIDSALVPQRHEWRLSRAPLARHGQNFPPSLSAISGLPQVALTSGNTGQAHPGGACFSTAATRGSSVAAPTTSRHPAADSRHVAPLDSARPGVGDSTTQVPGGHALTPRQRKLRRRDAILRRYEAVEGRSAMGGDVEKHGDGSRGLRGGSMSKERRGMVSHYRETLQAAERLVADVRASSGGAMPLSIEDRRGSGAERHGGVTGGGTPAVAYSQRAVAAVADGSGVRGATSGGAVLRTSRGQGAAAQEGPQSVHGGGVGTRGGASLCGRSPDEVAQALFTLGKFGRVDDIVTIMTAQLSAGVLDAKCAYLGLKALALRRRGSVEVPDLMRRMQEQGGGAQGQAGGLAGQGGQWAPWSGGGAGSSSGAGAGGSRPVALSRKDWQYILQRAAFVGDVDGCFAIMRALQELPGVTSPGNISAVLRQPSLTPSPSASPAAVSTAVPPTNWGKPSSSLAGWPDKPSYDLLVRACGDAGDLARAEALVREMMERNVTDDGSLWAHNYSSSGGGSTSADSTNGGRATNATMDTVASNNVDGSNAGNRDKGFPAQPRCPPNVATFSALATAYTRRGMVDAAYGVLEGARRYGCQLDAGMYNPLVAVLDVRRASALVDQMARDGVVPTVVTLTSLMRAHQSEMGADPSSAADASLALLDRMAASNVAVDSSAWNVAVRSCCLANRLDDALALVARMVAGGVMPDAITLVPFVEAYASRGDARGVARVYEACVRGKGSFWPPGWGQGGEGVAGSPNHPGPGGSKVSHATVAAHQNQQSIRPPPSLPLVTPDAVLYNATIRALLRVDDVAGAWGVFKDMRAKGGWGWGMPVVGPNAVTFNSMIAGLCERGDVQAAVALLREMRGGEGQGKGGRGDGVDRLLDENREWGSTSSRNGPLSSRDSAVASSSQLGNGDKRPPQRQGDTAGRASGGVAPDAVTYNTIINAYAGAPCVASALGVARLMEEQGVAPDRITYRSLLKACANAGDVREATATILRMRSRGFPVGPAEVNWLLLAHARARRNAGEQQRVRQSQPWRQANGQGQVAGDVPTGPTATSGGPAAPGGALQLLREIRAVGVAPDATTYALLLYAAAEAGDVLEAATIFGQMESHGLGGAQVTPTRRHWNALLHAATLARDPQAAASFLSGLESSGVHPDGDSFAKVTRAAGLPPAIDVTAGLGGSATGGSGQVSSMAPSSRWRQGRGADQLAQLRRVLTDPHAQLAPGARAFLELICAAASEGEGGQGAGEEKGGYGQAWRSNGAREGEGGVVRQLGQALGGRVPDDGTDGLDGGGEGMAADGLFPLNRAHIQRCIQTMVAAFGGTPRVAIFNAALGVAVSAGAGDVARHVLDMMREEEEGKEEGQKEVLSRALGEEGGTGARRAIAVGGETPSREGDAVVMGPSGQDRNEVGGGGGPLADADTFMLRLSLCVRQGDLQGAADVVEAARNALVIDAGARLHASAGPRKRDAAQVTAPARVTPASLTWLEEALARAHLLSGDLDAALAVVDKMRARGWRVTQGPASQRLFFNKTRRGAATGHPPSPALLSEGRPAYAVGASPNLGSGPGASNSTSNPMMSRHHQRVFAEASRQLCDELIFACSSAGMSNDDIIERLGLGDAQSPDAAHDAGATRWSPSVGGNHSHHDGHVAGIHNWNVRLRAGMEQRDPEEICAALRGLLHHAGRGGNAGSRQLRMDRDVLEALEGMSFTEVSQPRGSPKQELLDDGAAQAPLLTAAAEGKRAESAGVAAAEPVATSAAQIALWQDVQYLLWQVEIRGLVEGRKVFAS